jgi:hypothetical protein
MGASLPRPPSPSFNRWGVRDHHSNHTMQVRHHPIDVRVCDDPRVMEVVGSVRMQDEAVDDEHIAGLGLDLGALVPRLVGKPNSGISAIGSPVLAGASRQNRITTIGTRVQPITSKTRSRLRPTSDTL